MREEIRHTFSVCGYGYEIIITPENEIIFSMIYGRFEGEKLAGKDRFGDDMSTTKLLKVVKCPVAVLNYVKNYIKEFIFHTNPPYFFFTSDTREPKRTRVYNKISKRMEKEIPYTFIEDKGYFLFYKDTKEWAMNDGCIDCKVECCLFNVDGKCTTKEDNVSATIGCASAAYNYSHFTFNDEWRFYADNH
jgi:hypothetical protein